MIGSTIARAAAAALAFAAVLGGPAAGAPAAAQEAAQEVTLRLHHFLPPQAPASGYFEDWKTRVEAASEGRIEVEIYPSMQLGGSPLSLYDQAADGVVDLVWTLAGYTPGRFPLTEVFEMPFMPGSAEATSMAAMEFYQRHLAGEFDDTKVVMMHVHGPGLLHVQGTVVEDLADLEGLTLRAPTRMLNRAFELAGAEPVGMPIPQIPEALSRGVIDATVLPWEVTRSLRLAELVDSHTEFAGDRGLYTAAFVFTMNRDRYDALPDDLQAVIDAHSGIDEAQAMGRVMDAGDPPAKQLAVEQGNTIVVLGPEAQEEWLAAMRPVIEEWIASVDELGYDGAALYEEARGLVQEYSAQVDD